MTESQNEILKNLTKEFKAINDSTPPKSFIQDIQSEVNQEQNIEDIQIIVGKQRGASHRSEVRAIIIELNKYLHSTDLMFELVEFKNPSDIGGYVAFSIVLKSPNGVLKFFLANSYYKGPDLDLSYGYPQTGNDTVNSQFEMNRYSIDGYAPAASISENAEAIIQCSRESIKTYLKKR